MTTQIEALVVEPDGSTRIELIDGDWQSIKSLIGGWLEAVSGVLGQWMAYGDEEGNLKGLAPNYPAASLCLSGGGNPVIPVGTVVFVGMHAVGGEDGYVETNVPDSIKNAADMGI